MVALGNPRSGAWEDEPLMTEEEEGDDEPDGALPHAAAAGTPPEQLPIIPDVDGVDDDGWSPRPLAPTPHNGPEKHAPPTQLIDLPS